MNVPRWMVLPLLLWSTSSFAEANAPAPPLFDAQGRALTPLSERVVDYEIDVRLDAATRVLTGKEALTWRNRSAEPQATLWFHLYWNAFRNDRSTFLKEAHQSGSRDVGEDVPNVKKEDWAYSDVKAIAVRGGADLLSTLKFEHPDDDNAEDRTVFTVTLPQPVPPGGSVTLDIQWEARVPKAVERTGHMKGFFLLGQWFPKIGVLELPGERGATRPRWNCHQYHSTSEFYADFGTYDVRLTLPKAMKVGATGVQVEQRDNPDGTATTRFHQDDVHDFAWTAWEKFVVIEDVFRSPGLPEVKLTILANPLHPRAHGQLVEATKSALEHYGRWWYPFPYAHFTVVDVPAEALVAAGMEYPTFITTFSRQTPIEPKDHFMWDVLVHELGHNYWYGIMASNEFEESWLDEGINTYGTTKVILAEGIPSRFGAVLPGLVRPLLSNVFSMEWTPREEIRSLPRQRWSSPVVQAAWKFRDYGDYGMASYRRPQASLFALEQMLGEETMAKVMRTYVDRWKFRHPGSQDFFAVANEVSGQDLTWFWDAFFRGTAGLDYAVTGVACQGEDPAHKAGVHEDEKGVRTIYDMKERDVPPEEELQRCEVAVERRAEVRVPVDVKVTFEDGTTQVERWDGQAVWQRWTYERKGKGGKVKQAEIETRGVLALDASPVNNTRTRELKGHVPVAMFGWLTYVNQLVATVASLLG